MSEAQTEANTPQDKTSDVEVREYLETRVVRRRFFPRAIAVGFAAGAVAAAFKIILQIVEVAHSRLLASMPEALWQRSLVAAGLATVGTLVAILIGKYDKDAGGSGIPHVKAVLEGHAQMNWSRLIWVKFTAAVAAIGSGLALGREGPTVQMGGATGMAVAKFTGATGRERRALVAAGSGAGLAAAFNAPLAGVTFVLEELQRDFQPIVFSGALLSAAIATVVSQVVSGNAFAFSVPPIPTPTLAQFPFYILIGALAGLMAIVFNRGLMTWVGFATKYRSKHIFLTALVMGLAVGGAYLVSPSLLGGGLRLTEAALYGKILLAPAVAYLIARLVFVHTSYATGVPGGIFAPLLSLGALLGVVLFHLGHMVFPGAPGVAAFAVAGMCGLFSGVVRAPLTGIILIAEMTGSYDMLLPLLASAFTAYAVAEGLKDVPIYEALLQRDAMRQGWNLDDGEPITAEYEVKGGSPFDGKQLCDLGLGAGVLIVMCREGGRRFIPRASTVIREHMRIVVAASTVQGLQEVEAGVEHNPDR